MADIDYFAYKDNFSKNREIKTELCFEKKVSEDAYQISVVIPTYTHMESFRQALESCSTQTFRNFVVLVLDDSANQNVQKQHLEIIKSFQNLNIQYYQNTKNLGLFGNWNRCIELAPTELLVFLHDDDLLLPNALQCLLTLHKRNGNKCILVNHYDVNEKLERLSRPFIKDKLVDVSFFDVFMGYNVSTGCGCLFLKNQLLEIGGYYEEYYPTADWIMIIKLLQKYGLKYYGKPLVQYRVSAENTSASVFNVYSENLNNYRIFISKYIRCSAKIITSLIEIKKQNEEVYIKQRWEKNEDAVLNLSLRQKLIFLLAKIWCRLKWI